MFNPLGKFVADAPLSPDVIAAAKALAAKLPRVPARSISRIYLHWTVGHRAENFSDYNGAIRFDGTHFHMDVPHDPRDNAVGVNDNAPASHTYMRNTGAVGISTDDMIGATEHNFGPEPLTIMTLEWLCGAAAAFALAYDIDLSGLSNEAPYAHEPTMLTHAEAADRIGTPMQYASYGPESTCERWDLSSFCPVPSGSGVTGATATACGDALRSRSRRYKVALL